MKYSKLFGKTTRDVSRDLVLDSHKLLYQGGFIRQSVAGRYFLLPLGLKVRAKVQNIVREEMNKSGGQEMITPTLHPMALWKETNRDASVSFELMKVEDRRGEEFALGGTAEEMFTDVVRKMQISYRDLPFNLYQFSNKFRDEARSYGGMLRLREFVMKDAYSFDIDEEHFKKSYQAMYETYSNIFTRLGFEFDAVEADGGYIGDYGAHEFQVEFEGGEGKYFVSEDGKYKAHADVAKFVKENKNLDEELKDIKVVDAVRGKTMEDGVQLHNLPMWQQIKDVMFVDDTGRFVLAIIRGDFDVNETKLQKLIKVNTLRHATTEEITDVLHSYPGFISPVGIKEKMEKTAQLIIVADESLRTIKNAFGGANEQNKDSLNMNIDRDYKADTEGDIALAYEGAESLNNQGKLIRKIGTEVGNIFELRHQYSKKMNATFTDENGKEQFYYMGCYGIGLERTLQMIVEKHHDEKGIIWPKAVAPFDVHIVTLGEDENVVKMSEDVMQKLEAKGYEVLWDEREKVSAGEKFADADLIGCPLRIVVSKKTVDSGNLEMKYREKSEIEYISIDKVGELAI
jgi:prolyl-tRNA synthetase